MTTKTFKVLSALLSYPEEALQKAAPDLRSVLDDEELLPSGSRAAVDALIEDLVQTDVYDLQERYVELFDRTRSLSLHLFEHVYGESRDRGQAMIDLLAFDQSGGLFRRDVVAVDMRIPDRLVLQLSPEGVERRTAELEAQAKARKKAGKNT